MNKRTISIYEDDAKYLTGMKIHKNQGISELVHLLIEHYRRTHANADVSSSEVPVQSSTNVVPSVSVSDDNVPVSPDVEQVYVGGIGNVEE